MADDPNDIAQKGMDELFKGSNVLGNPTELRLTGTGSLPGGGAAAALPAPSGPGGRGGGFLGGGQGSAGAGTGGVGGKLAGMAKDEISKAVQAQGDLGTRGNVGGEGTPQGENQSLSDRLRGGEIGLSSLFNEQGSLGPVELGGQPLPSFNTEFLGGLEEGGVPAAGANAALEGALGGIDWSSIAGGAAGALGGVLGLAQGIQSGDPMKTGTGALGAVQGASALSGSLGGPTISGGLAAVAPEATAAVLSSLTGSAVPATSAGISAGISAAASAYALPVAALIQIVTSALEQQQLMADKGSGWWNNPIKGQLYSNATQGVGQAQAGLDRLGEGGMKGASTLDLANTLGGGVNSLLPYYQTAPGGLRELRASESAGSPGTQSKDEYTQNFTKANQGMAQIVNELLGRGITYEQLGQLPVTGNWAQGSLDTGNTPQEMLWNTYSGSAPGQTDTRLAEGSRLAAQLLSPQKLAEIQQTSGYSQNDVINALLTESLGSSMAGPDKATNASGLMTSMYGGPLWAAMARSGAGGDQGLMGLINQHFDPWVNARQMDPAARQQFYAVENLARNDPAAYAQMQAEGRAPQVPTTASSAPNPNADFWSNMAAERGQQQQQAQKRTATAQQGLGQGHGSFDAMLSDEQKREMGLI